MDADRLGAASATERPQMLSTLQGPYYRLDTGLAELRASQVGGHVHLSATISQA